MDNPVVWLLGLIVVLLITDAIIGVRKSGGMPALQASVKTHDLGAVKDELLAGFKFETDALKQQFAITQRAIASVPQQVVNGIPAAPQAQPATAMLPRYIDRDDLMKAIGATGMTQQVTIEGAIVHAGFGPPLAYVKQADGSLAIG